MVQEIALSPSAQKIDTDLYDMEAYALAKLCLIENINYFCSNMSVIEQMKMLLKIGKECIRWGERHLGFYLIV